MDMTTKLSRVMQLAAGREAVAGLLQQLFPLVADLNRMEADKKLANKIAGGNIKAKKEEIDKLVREIEASLYVDKPDFDRGVVDKVQIDTGEVVETRPLTPAERQLHLAETDPDTPMPPPKGPSDVEAELDAEFGKDG